MPPREGLPGLDSSLPFSRTPLHHLFVVINGAGDPYVDHQPWMPSLESSLAHLNHNYTHVANTYQKPTRTRTTPPSAPSVLFLPLEWHHPAFQSWQASLRHAEPRPKSPGDPPSVRDAVAETVGDVLLLASPFWRRAIAKHLASQLAAQLAAVRRTRPIFTGRVSLLAHSIGGVLAVELLSGDLLNDVQLDSVVFTGCPLPAYAALSPDGGHQVALSTIRQRRNEVRFINVFHPLDPAAYRLEPFVLPEGQAARSAIRVTPRRRTFWDDASMFWDDVVFNLWGTLFPKREAADGAHGRARHGRVRQERREVAHLDVGFDSHVQGSGTGSETRRAGDGNGSARTESGQGVDGDGGERNAGHRDSSALKRRSSGTRMGESRLHRSSSYVIPKPRGRHEGERQRGQDGRAERKLSEDGRERVEEKEEEDEEKKKKEEEEEEEETGCMGGSEVLLSDRIDYELQDGMGVPPLDVMASWGAIKAHTYYWQSMDVAQMLLDIAVTSDDALAAR